MEQCVKLGGGHLDEGLVIRDSSVIEEYVDTAKKVDRPIDQSSYFLNMLEIGDVARIASDRTVFAGLSGG